MAESLEMNRVFDTNQLQTMLNDGETLLDAAVEASETYNEKAGKILGLMGEIPAEYRVSFLAGCAEELQGSIQIAMYEEMKIRLNTLLNKLIDNIPATDTKYAEEIKTATTELTRVASLMIELKGLLLSGAGTNDYDKFSRRLEVLKNHCEKAQISVEELRQMAEMELKGMEPEWVPYSVDPVNLSTGNFVYRKPDLVIEGKVPIRFNRYYNAIDRHRGVMGRNWVHSYETCLTFQGEQIRLQEADGREVILHLKDRKYRSEHGSEVIERTDTEDGIQYLYEKEGFLYVYDVYGKYVRGEDKSGNRIQLIYEGDRLASIITDCGTSVRLSYTEEGLLECICDHTERKVYYRYENSRLTEVIDTEEHSLKYTYGINGRIEQVINGRGIMAVKNSYDDRRRITKQEFPDGGVMTFRYLDQSGQVILREQNGNEITYEHDNRGRNVKTIYVDGEEQNSYDAHNRQIYHKDKNGNETWYCYEEEGKVTKIVNALEEETKLVYDTQGRMTQVIRADGSKEQYCYDNMGNMTSMVNGEGDAIQISYRRDGRPGRVVMQDQSVYELSYDKAGNLTEIRNRTGVVAAYVYDALNRVIQSSDGNGNCTEYAYDRENRIVQITNAEGNSRTLRYNGAGAVEEIRDFDGNTMSWTYDKINKPVVYRDKAGRVTRMSYDTMWNMTEKVLPDGGKITYTYDLLQRLQQETDQTGAVTRYGYDPCGNRISVTSPEGVTTYTAYDALNRPVAWTDGEGCTERAVYGASGRIVRRENKAGGVRTYSYDKAGRLLCETDEAGGKTSYRYNALGQPETITDAAGRTTKCFYLPGGLLHRVEYPDGSSSEYTYDACGNVTALREGDGRESSFAYDCMNRLVRIQDNRGRDTRYFYDAMGNVTGKQEADGSIIHYSYTPDGFLSGVDDSEGMRARYAYDPADRLCAILKLGKEEQEPDWENVLLSGDTYRNCHGLFFLRNKRGDIETVRDGEGHARRMQYDRDGHMRNMQDEDGYLTFYGYDKNGKLRVIHYQDGRETAMQYDPLGQLVQMQDWLGSLTIERDVMGRPETVTDHTGQKTEYLWGAAGERRGMVYPDGMKIQYAYDDALRLTDITAGEPGAGGMSIHYEYSPTGQRTRKFYGSGNGAEDSAMESIRKYDSTGLLSGIIHRNREGILEQYEYTYDVRGNRQEIRKYRKDIPEDSGDFYYEYDTMRRLTGVARDGMMLRTYSFDVYGNRKRVRDYTAGTGINYAYSAGDRLLSAECRYEDGRLITTSYEYDGRGNLVLEREPAGGTEYRYAYGAINRLEKWTGTGYNETSYSYNGLGYRVGMHDGREMCGYLLDYTQPYHNLLGVETEKYLWDTESVNVIGKDAVRYSLADELGTPLRYCDVEGHTTGYSIFQEYGMGEVRRGMLSPIGYTGYQREMHPDHYHAMSRSYDAALGRFRSRDVEEYIKLTDTLTLNRYLYCGANPLSYVDVMGFGYTDYVAPVKDTVEGWIRTAENWAVERLAWKENPNNDSWWYNYMYRFDCGVRQGAVQWLGDTLVSIETMALDSVAMMFDPTYTIYYAQKQICDFANSMHYMGEAIETYTIPGLITMKWDEITESPDALGRAVGRVAPDIILAVVAKNIELEAEATAGRKVYEGGTGTLKPDELIVRDSKFLDADGNIDWDTWAPNGGRVPGTIQEGQTLDVGTIIDRYGNPYGKYISPIGVPYEQRALPYVENPNAYHKYEVLKPIDNVTISQIAEAFEQPGGGMQYELPSIVNKLIKDKFLREIE